MREREGERTRWRSKEKRLCESEKKRSGTERLEEKVLGGGGEGVRAGERMSQRETGRDRLETDKLGPETRC